MKVSYIHTHPLPMLSTMAIPHAHIHTHTLPILSTMAIPQAHIHTHTLPMLSTMAIPHAHIHTYIHTHPLPMLSRWLYLMHTYIYMHTHPLPMLSTMAIPHALLSLVMGKPFWLSLISTPPLWRRFPLIRGRQVLHTCSYVDVVSATWCHVGCYTVTQVLS